MEEYWDIFDENRVKTGETHRRGEVLKNGDYHLVIHVCIFNSQNQILLQKRQSCKVGWPNMWDLAAAGSALTGENSRDAAIREVKEELGITLDLTNDRPRFTINFEYGFDDYWIIERDIEISALTLQQEEVADAKWVTEEELHQMIKRNEIIPYWFLNDIFKIRKLNGTTTLPETK